MTTEVNSQVTTLIDSFNGFSRKSVETIIEMGEIIGKAKAILNKE